MNIQEQTKKDLELLLSKRDDDRRFIVEKAEKCKAEIDAVYSQAIACHLINSLDKTSKLIDERVKYGHVSDEDIKIVSELKPLVRCGKAKENLGTLLKAFKPMIADLLSIDNIENIRTPKDILTYVSFDATGCQVLAPVCHNSNDVTKDYSEKLFGVLGLGNISLGHGNVIEFKNESLEYINGFLTFGLKTSDPKLLATKLIAKLSAVDIQPKSFRKYNLVHKAQSLDFEIVKCFMDYSASSNIENNVNTVVVPTGNSVESKSGKVTRAYKTRVTKTMTGLTPESEKVYSRIALGFEDPKIVIDLYDQLNADYKQMNADHPKKAGKDMPLSAIHTFSDIGDGKGRGGWSLYFSLLEHLEKGTILPEQISTSSNMSKYTG